MHDTVTEELAAVATDYPLLFARGAPGAAISVCAGWLGIFRALCADINAALTHWDGERIEITQVKEKFGKMRVLFSLQEGRGSRARSPGLGVEVQRLVDAACAQSLQTCARCGAPGDLRVLDGWSTVLCQFHLEQSDAARNLGAAISAVQRFDMPTRGWGQPVLYLDLDGVVHHHAVLCSPRRGIHMSPKEAPGRMLFEWLPHLEACLRPYPEIRLVLSSSWCIRPGYGRTLERMPPALRQRFVGGTYHRRVHGANEASRHAFSSTPRWQQIYRDVQRRNPSEWLAVDDDVVGWPLSLQDNLVSCRGERGLSDPQVRQVLLARLHRLAR